jgi:hypothetical protein
MMCVVLQQIIPLQCLYGIAYWTVGFSVIHRPTIGTRSEVSKISYMDVELLARSRADLGFQKSRPQAAPACLCRLATNTVLVG